MVDVATAPVQRKRLRRSRRGHFTCCPLAISAAVVSPADASMRWVLLEANRQVRRIYPPRRASRAPSPIASAGPPTSCFHTSQVATAILYRSTGQSRISSGKSRLAELRASGKSTTEIGLELRRSPAAIPVEAELAADASRLASEEEHHPKLLSRHGKRWTPEEKSHLARMRALGMSYKEIAQVLRRSADAVRATIETDPTRYPRKSIHTRLHWRPEKTGRPWTTRDKARLAELYSQGTKRVDIARKLDRTVKSVDQKLTRQGNGKERKPPWTAAEKTSLVELYNQGMEKVDIARKLGRTAYAIKSILHILRKQVYVKVRVRFWTAAEETRLAELQGRGMRLTDIARELGRTYTSVKRKASKMKQERERP
ncbi:hypothetical protein GGR56DRAFT_567187 [Xylariaceae sp. FL0804]|nr:hypothetical protein GGR56DRAFT_567187 [Xylariaceae sp. FL0804]